MSWTQLQFLFCCELLTFGKVSSVPSLIKTSMKKTTTKANVQYMNRCETYALKKSKASWWIFVCVSALRWSRATASWGRSWKSGRSRMSQAATTRPINSGTYCGIMYIFKLYIYYLPTSLPSGAVSSNYVLFFLNISRHWYWNTADVYSASR